MQIFNEFNNRRLNKFNIFDGVHRNPLFIIINCLMVGLQIAIISVGSRAFSINPDGLHGTQWAISIMVALVCLPWAVAIRLFPDAWFAAIVAFVGKPFVVVYKALTNGWDKVISVFKKRKNVQDDDESGIAPVVVISSTGFDDRRDIERKKM